MAIGDEQDPDTPIYNEVLHGGNDPKGFDYAEQRGFELGQGIVRMSQIIQATMNGVTRGINAAQAEESGDDASNA
mgnify:CR=1 FL=1